MTLLRAAAIVCLTGGVASAQEEPVALRDVPPAVLSNARTRFPTAKLLGVTKETEEGKTFYEVSLSRGGRTIDVTTTLAGDITLIERELGRKEVPRVVAELLDTEYPHATIRLIEEVKTVSGKTETLSFYEAQLIDNKKQRLEVQVSADGLKVLKIEKKKAGEQFSVRVDRFPQIDPRSVRFRAASIGVTLRFQNDSLATLAPEMQRILTLGLERYRLLFGGPPKTATGHASDTLSVVVTSDRIGSGDSDAGIVRLALGPRPAFGFYDWRLTLLHEAFHLWNAESFRYASAREQWFNEGVSEFYALQTAAHLGVIDGAEAIRNAATAVGFYTSAFEQDKLSLTSAGMQKRSHYFLVYHGGWTAALVMDHDIRDRTHNAKSLDDVMRWMYVNFDRVRLYHTKDIARAIKLTTGLNYDSFFARFIEGRVALPVSAALNLGELAMAYDARRAGVTQAPSVDALLLATLGIK